MREVLVGNPLLDLARQALPGREQCVERHRLGRHTLEVVREVVTDVAQRRK
jgi:hypothetical protein